MEEKAKIRINLTSREFEVEGSEEFINKYENTITSFLKKIYNDDQNNEVQAKQVKPEAINKVDTSINSANTADDIVDDEDISFGELYNKMPNSAKDVDKMLLAGYFVQMNSDEKIFSTREASSLLVEQGVKLTNPSASMTANKATKKVFKHKGGYRISESGLSYIKSNFGGE